MIADDPLADNTDVYAFRSPQNPNKVILIANYIPMQLPDGGPNYYHFGENIRYEIHIDNNTATPGDDITYRFTFTRTNEDPTTFFNIRLGKENLNTSYTLERIKGGVTTTIVSNGKTPPYNVGPRSITMPVGLNAPSYETLMQQAIMTATTGERVFAGPVDDPFFVDAGGIFDLGDAPRTAGIRQRPQDVLRYKNVSTLALEVDISTLQKDGKSVSQAANILDPNFVIGVWASASRRKMRVLNGDGTETHSGDWVQVSRLGMPLTNEAIIPIGYKDRWNSSTPYEDLGNLATYGNFFYNPELALYMDETKFAAAVPAFMPLRIQHNSLGMFGFGNGENGLYPLRSNPSALAGTALGAFPDLLLPGPGKPRSVDIWPIFHTGVPNLPPYQLATTKGGNPLAAGKPFINNFLPNGGDMLRLNMAVPVTPRNSADFSSEGLIQAAVLGLTDPRFNNNNAMQPIPNMDGFPNGRRLEDDVTRIELQAVSGIVLAAIGLPYDDYKSNGLLSIMEMNTVTSATISGYMLIGSFNGHTYYKSTMRQSWFGARMSAHAAGGYLTTISSMAEQDYVYTNGVRNPNITYSFENGVWIGLNDADMEGTFVWENGEPVTFTYWEQGEPNNANGNEDFVEMKIDNGKWNDYNAGNDNLVTKGLLNVLSYQTGINRNDTTFKAVFPFEQTPWPGTYNWDCSKDNLQMQTTTPTQQSTMTTQAAQESSFLNLRSPASMISAIPSLVTSRSKIMYHLATPSAVQIIISDAQGRKLKVLTNARQAAGNYSTDWDASGVSKGVYFVTLIQDGQVKQTLRLVRG